MAEDDKRRGNGAKATRTETVTVRLEPKLRYLAEIAARKQRRTLSSFVEWAVNESLKSVLLEEGLSHNDDVSVANVSSALWDVDESERFVRLATKYPELMAHDEAERWKMLMDSGVLNLAKSRDRYGQLSFDHAVLEDRIYPRLRALWPGLLEAHAAGPARAAQWVKDTAAIFPAEKMKVASAQASSGLEDMDDDIPF